MASNRIGTGLSIPTRGRETGMDLPALSSVLNTATLGGEAGTYVPGMSTPTLSITGTTATITNAAATTNTLIFSDRGGVIWWTIGSIVGNGTVEIDNVASGDYTGRVMAIGSPGTVSDSEDFSVAGASPSGGVNANWGRWIYASICQHFEDLRSGLLMFLEGEHRTTQDTLQFFELRVDGPFFQQFTKGYWNLKVEINAIITVPKSDKDFHNIRKQTDFVTSMFTNSILTYRYGKEIQDDNTYLGCLQAEDGKRKNLQVSHFGQLQTTDEILQAGVERHYKMELAEE